MSRALLMAAGVLAAVALIVYLLVHDPSSGALRPRAPAAAAPIVPEPARPLASGPGPAAATRASGSPAPVAAPAAAGTAAIEGRAVDADTGMGVAGVEVAAYARGFERATRTAADGAFRIGPVPVGRAVIIAFPETYEPATETFELGDLESRHVTLTLRAGAAVDGAITGPRGPVAFATVEVRAAGDPPKPLLRARAARADEAGRYGIAGLPPGRAVLVARAPGLAPPAIEREVDAPRGGVARADFAFREGAAIEGRVLDEGGGGLAGATVSVEVDGVFDPFEKMTDDAGAYRIAGLPGGGAGAVVRARLAGHAPGESPRLALAEGEAIRGLDIALARGVRIEGRVLLPDGAPAGRAKVTLLDAGARIAAALGAGPDGRFAFEDVRPGQYRLTASLPGQLDAETAFFDAGLVRSPIVLELGRGAGSILGSVVDADGRPVPGARVETPRPADPERRLHAVTNDEGTFHLEGLPQGLRDLYLVDPETGEETVHPLVVERPGFPPTPVVLRLAGRGAAQSRAELVILLPRGIVEDAAVIVSPEDAHEPVGAALGRDGLFRAAGLVPGKRYRVLVLTGASGSPVAERTVDLVEGENRLDLSQP